MVKTKLIQGDCLELMKNIEDNSVNMILCDLPYGTTACSWDEIIPFEKLWEEYERIKKPEGIIVLNSSQPFTTKMINSNLKLFKYCWIWDKERGSGHLLAEIRPMMCTEDIVVFYEDLNSRKQKVTSFEKLREYFYNILVYLGESNKSICNKLGHRKAEHFFYVLPRKHIIKKVGSRADHCFRYGSTQWDMPTGETYQELINIFGIDKYNEFRCYEDLKKEYIDEEKTLGEVTYNPQMRPRDKPRISTNKGSDECYNGNGKEFRSKVLNERYPVNLITFNKSSHKDMSLHPTQKPVALMEYLIKTYTNEGDLVLDNCMGSGTTGVACVNLNRDFIGMELDEKYFEIAKERINKLNSEKADKTCATKHVIPPKSKDSGILPKFT